MKSKKYIVPGLLLIIASAVVFCSVYYRTQTVEADLKEAGYILGGDGFLAVPYDKYFEGTVTPSGVDIGVYGASPEKSAAENTVAINLAVQSLEPGQTLVVSGGRYSTGTIRLKSDMTLFVEKGSKLVSCTYEENKAADVPLLSSAFIYANNVKNVIITGGGMICGNSDSFLLPAKSNEPLMPLKYFNVRTLVLEQRKRIRFPKDNSGRAELLQIRNSDNITIRGIELRDSASWTCHIQDSKYVTIENTIINSNIRTANADGIDINGSRDVVVRNCFIVCADDGICLKTRGNSPVENVLIEGCEVMSLANAFKIGTETNKDIRDVTVKDCHFFVAGTIGGYAGIAVESADGAVVENIRISNIKMTNVNAAFLIWLGYRNGRDGVGAVKDIIIENVEAEYVNLPSAITGCKYKGTIYAVENVNIRNVSVSYRDGGERLIGRRIDVKASAGGYPEITRVSHYYIISHNISIYFDMPVYGLFGRYCKDITVENFQAVPRTGTRLKMSNI